MGVIFLYFMLDFPRIFLYNEYIKSNKKKRGKDMTNKEIAELMFFKMKKMGFTPYDIEKERSMESLIHGTG